MTRLIREETYGMILATLRAVLLVPRLPESLNRRVIKSLLLLASDTREAKSLQGPYHGRN